MADSEIGSGGRRAHTGRRRNDEARRAILDAALALLTRGGPVSVDELAHEAGVGKQTIYRWWPSKTAVLLEALTTHAGSRVPTPDTGSLHEDVVLLLTATFREAGQQAGAALLRSLAAEAGRSAHAAELVRQFTEARRDVLQAVLRRGRDRGELPTGADLDMIVDQAYGFFWYRFLLGHGPLTDDVARRLVAALLAGASH